MRKYLKYLPFPFGKFQMHAADKICRVEWSGRNNVGHLELLEIQET